ncbi:hypothetical protein L226DRAFT_538877 [Lentinus tigrinus ALCF2SS1-7]|uniref:Uncharacterized protein n=1 Tax=Lentinus tigrinus ALCF2SS1-6 TaxID=1328759 RepID=A0A5C2S4T0_9APHY|nr:hypothetical protein L227DRAFT_577600 [Lentinus tigrinus ALCF2SS1-6]RPD70406.1 hypothetical protein L226DRAFT_538877 [Lentinus tigrinus ALCF2SS1-7]
MEISYPTSTVSANALRRPGSSQGGRLTLIGGFRNRASNDLVSPSFCIPTYKVLKHPIQHRFLQVPLIRAPLSVHRRVTPDVLEAEAKSVQSRRTSRSNIGGNGWTPVNDNSSFLASTVHLRSDLAGTETKSLHFYASETCQRFSTTLPQRRRGSAETTPWSSGSFGNIGSIRRRTGRGRDRNPKFARPLDIRICGPSWQASRTDVHHKSRTTEGTGHNSNSNSDHSKIHCPSPNAPEYLWHLRTSYLNHPSQNRTQKHA